MARVVLSDGLNRRFTDGRTEIEVQASDVRQLIRMLDDLYPGLGRELQSGMAVAIDGEICPDSFLEPIEADSEVYFLPLIEGG